MNSLVYYELFYIKMNRKHIFNSNATPQRFYSHGENFKQVVVAVINTYASNLTSEMRHVRGTLGIY